MATNPLDGLVLQELPTIARSAQLMKSQVQIRQEAKTTLKSIYAASAAEAVRPLGQGEVEYGGRLQKSVSNMLDGPDDSLERLAFERDPQRITEYAGIYRPKLQGVPDSLLKRMAIQDDLVAAVVHTRSNHVAQFGRKQDDRHGKGFKFVVDKGVEEKLDEKGRVSLQERISRASKLLTTCGQTNGWSEQEKCSFSEFLYMQARNCIVVGRMATEIVWTPNPEAPTDASRRKFHSFRPTDAGTIYYAAPYHEVNQQVREMALRLMENLKNEKLQKEKFENEEYAWVQVFEGRPMQAFGAQEMLVHSPYNITDIEQMGYPVTPLDTALSAVTTHINITHHNRLYFQTGRAARGMLIIKSPDIDPEIVAGVKQQFNASINSVQNAWRMPVFGLGVEDEITWAPIDSAGGRDMEFQYLADANARTILAAFQMSPEELPGYQHLSRGTNNQALCLSLQSLVLVPEGLRRIEDVLGGSRERTTKVWTGTTWCDARVFVTGARKKATTTLWNGSRLETSPDHRFRSVDTSGQPAWVHQKDLQVGSYVLVNRRAVTGAIEPPSYNGRTLTPDVMEMLGWLTGDGNINVRFSKSTGNVKQGVLTWFYHHEKERDVWEKHSKVLDTFGLNCRHVERAVGERESSDIKERYGFSSVAATRLTNRLYDTSFVKWLITLGFQSSTDGKVIPAFVHTLPVEYRQAFLRGLFSADGTCNKLGASGVRIVIHDDQLRQQTRDLLLGLGIRTQFHEGLKKQSIDGPDREMVNGSSTLSIKDKSRFYELVGFIQHHKQPGSYKDERKEDRIPGVVVRALLVGHSSSLRSEPNAPRAIRQGCSRLYLQRLLETASLREPQWLCDHYLEEVVSVERTDEVEEMADVEVFNEEHAFVASGVVVHNSESNEEYKLTAARDVGIRPLIASFEDFLNSSIVPLIDPELSKVVKLKLLGLDVDTAEKESVRIQQDMGVFMTFNDILNKLEKKALPKHLAADIPLNPTYFQYLQMFVPFGRILEDFLGIPNASQDPQYNFFMNPFWQQQQQMVQQQQAMAQQAAQGGQPGQPPPGGGGGQGGPPGDGGAPPGQDEEETQLQDQQRQSAQVQNQPDLSGGLDQLMQVVSKSENLVKGEAEGMVGKAKRLRARTIAANDAIMKKFAEGMEHRVRRIADIATDAVPAKK